MRLTHLRSAPPSASGRTRHDMMLSLADASITALWAISAAVRRPAAPQDRDRTLTLQITSRAVVARDQNVVTLTLAAPDGRPLPAWH